MGGAIVFFFKAQASVSGFEGIGHLIFDRKWLFFVVAFGGISIQAKEEHGFDMKRSVVRKCGICKLECGNVGIYCLSIGTSFQLLQISNFNCWLASNISN